ncbi:pentatricopeptide repeat-containing protein At1g74630 isoform X2 [Hevea brasiliensis]|uniref:pentatricopeptide repeat-containing protein At1g74630 isoform X2 n=1 Tax=Hevea brasiliensis TaxID=3981 RepID=UPI0025EECA33|nr:pentatricopeptide repeat-containing protein At1g74630 isoform X2 [Hevea brasiliensis]
MYSKPASTLTLSLLENYSSAAQWYSPIHWTMLAASFATLQSQMSSCTTPSFEALPKRATANLRSLRAGIQLHCQALTHGLNAHLFVGTTLVSMYGECGCIRSARKVFDEMHEPNVVAWNAVITAFFRVGNVKGAREMFDLMPFRDLTSWNVMLAGHVKERELELARKMFMEMPVKDDVSWSTIIVGFAHNGYFDEAFGFFRKLQRDGTRPNEVSLTGVLSACGQAGAFEFGKILHGFIEKAGLIWIISVNNALLDAYSKCGNLSMARLVFERMPEKKSIVSWTSMMVGLAMHGHGEEAIRLFHEMERSETRPDGITFISLLYACSHAGLIEQGCEYFNKMRDVYNIKPAIEHYGCMVDLYGRAGQLQKAYEFVFQMPIPPNDIIWRTLLGACSIHGNVKLAEKVKERLSELDPNNSSDHVLLSNIYAVAGKWKDVAAVRRSMTDQRIKKTPGWSMIEVDKVMYTFMAGPKQDKIMEEAYEMLKDIILRLRVEGGYVPEIGSVLHDIDEEEKEDSVSTHSEKLAVAFGIARLCEGKTIRIVKNLRICRDCHVVMKLISQVYKLEIVVRDRSRFHSFRNGSCSCEDYW